MQEEQQKREEKESLVKEQNEAQFRKSRLHHALIWIGVIAVFVIALSVCISSLHKVSTAERAIDAIVTVTLDSRRDLLYAQSCVENARLKLRKIRNIDVLMQKQEQYNAIVAQAASALDKEIAALEGVEVRYTSSYEALIASVESAYSRANEDVHAQLKYGGFLDDTKAAFEARKEACKVSCPSRVSCPDCGGKGKYLVTWYEYGDWGEKSYSSYKCNKCNGSGKIDCSICHGKGYYYSYEH